MARISLPRSTLVPSRRTTSGTRDGHLARSRHDAFGDDVATHDAAEDVDQDALHRRVGEDDLERRLHLFLGGAAADVEEVGGLRAIELDDVHGRHGEAGAVDHAADRAVELDVRQLVLRRLELHRIFFGLVAQRDDVGMAEQRVAVEVHLGVEADQLAVLRHHQRVDLEQAHVLVEDQLVEALDHLRALLRSGRP